MKPVQGEPWPVERRSHAACCLNYGQDHPQLLVHGGEDTRNQVLADMWILDVDTGKWTEVRMVYTNCFSLRLEASSTCLTKCVGVCSCIYTYQCVYS